MSLTDLKRISLASALSRRVWTALRWQGFFEVLHCWSVRPCVRPVDAVHMTAGHNAFREDWSRPKTRARSARRDWGFLSSGFDRLLHYFMSALPNFVGRSACRPA
jgi:hypothetical protein